MIGRQAAQHARQRPRRRMRHASAAGSTHSRWFEVTRSSRSPRCTGSQPMNASRAGTRHAADPDVPSISGTPPASATYRSTRPDAAVPSEWCSAISALYQATSSARTRRTFSSMLSSVTRLSYHTRSQKSCHAHHLRSQACTPTLTPTLPVDQAGRGAAPRSVAVQALGQAAL